MTKDLSRLLTQVYNCDTKAGHNLRYHIQRALACKEYKQKLNFEPRGAVNLYSLFTWRCSSEGAIYWNRIAMMLGE